MRLRVARHSVVSDVLGQSRARTVRPGGRVAGTRKRTARAVAASVADGAEFATPVVASAPERPPSVVAARPHHVRLTRRRIAWIAVAVVAGASSIAVAVIVGGSSDSVRHNAAPSGSPPDQAAARGASPATGPGSTATSAVHLVAPPVRGSGQPSVPAGGDSGTCARTARTTPAGPDAAPAGAAGSPVGPPAGAASTDQPARATSSRSAPASSTPTDAPASPPPATSPAAPPPRATTPTPVLSLDLPVLGPITVILPLP